MKFIYFDYETGLMTQQEEETMNDNLNTPVANADMAAAQANPFLDPKLTDEQLAALLAAKPDGIVGYTTDAIETDDEATETSPTIH